MSLDLFAVLFGGAIALLPVFAKDILHVGAGGLGLLNAAPSIGALSATLIATRYPPLKHAAGTCSYPSARSVCSLFVFAFSKNLALSLRRCSFPACSTLQYGDPPGNHPPAFAESHARGSRRCR
jgi:hypothetical protein